jgi:hypothetical protein
MDRMLPFLNCGIATRLNRAIGAAGLSPAGLWPCRPLQSGRNSARAPRGGREAQPVADRRPFSHPIGHVSPSPPPIRYSRISRVPFSAAAYPRRTFPLLPRLKHSHAYTPWIAVIPPTRHRRELSSSLTWLYVQTRFSSDIRHLPRAPLPE